MNLPLAIVKAKVRNWEFLAENNRKLFYSNLGVFHDRLHYYKKLQRKIELEQFYGVKLSDV